MKRFCQKCPNRLKGRRGSSYCEACFKKEYENNLKLKNKMIQVKLQEEEKPSNEGDDKDEGEEKEETPTE